MGEPLSVGHVILVPMCLHPQDERKKQIGNHPLLEKVPFFSPWSMAVKSKVVTIDVTFMMLLVLQLLRCYFCGQRPAFFSQASEDAMRMHVDDSDHCLRAPIQLLGGIRNVPWISRVFRYNLN